MGRKILLPDNGVLVAKTAYDKTVGIIANASSPVIITLPDSETYQDVELWVELRGQLLRPGTDYNFLGTEPRTQIELLQDVKIGDSVRIRKLS